MYFNRRVLLLICGATIVGNATSAIPFGSNAEFAQLENDVTELKEELRQLRVDNDNLKKKMDEIKPMNVTPVGFTAVITSTQNLTDGDTVAFDLLLVNTGDGFSLITNTFTCPVAGFYYFYFSLFNNGGNANQTASATLQLDGANQVRAHSQISGRDVITLPVTNGAFLFCAAGGRVSLRSDFDNNVIGSSSGRTSSFVGYLVFE